MAEVSGKKPNSLVIFGATSASPTSASTPYEWTDVTSNTEHYALLSQAYLLYGAQAATVKFLDTFKDFPPPAAAAALFSIDQAVDKMKSTIGAHLGAVGYEPDRPPNTRRPTPAAICRITVQAMTNGVVGCRKTVGRLRSKTKCPVHIIEIRQDEQLQPEPSAGTGRRSPRSP